MIKTNRGQATIETALTIPIFFILIMVFVSLLLFNDAKEALDTATGLAASAAAASPAEKGIQTQSYAVESFCGTMKYYNYPYLELVDSSGLPTTDCSRAIQITCGGTLGCPNGYSGPVNGIDPCPSGQGQGQPIKVTVHANLYWSQTVVGAFVPIDHIPMNSTATVYTSCHRST